jgi:hypothetical protein
VGIVHAAGGFNPPESGGSAVKAWKGWSVGAGIAGLCLVGVLTVVTTAAAHNRPAQAAVVGCGSLDPWAEAGLGTHVSATAVLGSTSATLEGTVVDALFTRGLGFSTLTIRNGDVTVRSGPVDVPAGWEDPSATILPDDIVRQPAPSPDGRDSMVPLCLARFAGSDHPVVLMGLFTGGAHCCTVLRAYPIERNVSGAGIDLQIGNPGVDVRSDGDRAIVVTADDVFNYEFNAYAFSGVPIKVLELRKGSFADSTRRHADLVRTDAAQWWKSFDDDPAQGLGFLAAWVADQCLLDKGPSAWATIDGLLAQGKLAGPPDNGGLWPAGPDYVANLHRFLPEHGYCK